MVAGYKLDEFRDMIPRDVWLVFDGWREMHEPKKPGSNAMSAEQYRALVERVDGGQR